MKISEDVIVLTGGGPPSQDLVTRYELTERKETPLTPLTQGRNSHACGVYQDTVGQQVSWGVETMQIADYDFTNLFWTLAIDYNKKNCYALTEIFDLAHSQICFSEDIYNIQNTSIPL